MAPCRQFLRFAFSLAGAGVISIAFAGKVAAQQAPNAFQQAANAGSAVENNGEDFTRPQTLFQLRYLYQTAPGSGSAPGTIRTVTTDL